MRLNCRRCLTVGASQLYERTMSAIAAQQAEKCLHVQTQATLYERTMSAIAAQQAEKCLHVQVQATLYERTMSAIAAQQTKRRFQAQRPRQRSYK